MIIIVIIIMIMIIIMIAIVVNRTPIRRLIIHSSFVQGERERKREKERGKESEREGVKEGDKHPKGQEAHLVEARAYALPWEQFHVIRLLG